MGRMRGAGRDDQRRIGAIARPARRISRSVGVGGQCSDAANIQLDRLSDGPEDLAKSGVDWTMVEMMDEAGNRPGPAYSP